MTHVIVSKALMGVFSYTDQTRMFEALVNAKLYCARHVHTCLEEFEECNTKGKEYPVNACWPDRATYWLAQANYFQKLLDTLEVLPETEWNTLHKTHLARKVNTMSIIARYHTEYQVYVADLPTFHDDEGNVVQPLDVSIEHLVDKGYSEEALIGHVMTLARFQIISDMLAEKESN